MTTTEQLEKIADELGEDLRGTLDARATFVTALQKAFDLGAKNATGSLAPAQVRDAFGQAKDPEKRQGFVLNAVHTIDAAQIAEHGEDALLAWIRQTLRELAANGANPMKDAAFQIVGLEDGTVVLTAEAGL